MEDMGSTKWQAESRVSFTLGLVMANSESAEKYWKDISVVQMCVCVCADHFYNEDRCYGQPSSFTEIPVSRWEATKSQTHITTHTHTHLKEL